MSAEKIPGRIRADEQEPDQGASFLKKKRSKKYGTWHYDDTFPEIAYKILSESENAKTKTHLCNVFLCSVPTLNRWLKNFPEFQDAVAAGFQAGEEKWRKRLADHAFEPSAHVNNGLIKMLSGNVYGIREESEPVIIQATIITDPESLLKDRGIPVPKMDIDDFDAELPNQDTEQDL